MTNTTEHIEKNLSSLECLLGEDNVENIKKEIGDLIVERVASDIRDYDYYLFYPGDYNEEIDKAFEKVKKKITKMWSDAALESATEAVERFKDISQAALTDTQGLQLRSCHKCSYKNGNKCKFYEDYYWRAHDQLCASEGFINFEEIEKNKKDKRYKNVNVFAFD